MGAGNGGGDLVGCCRACARHAKHGDVVEKARCSVEHGRQALVVGRRRCKPHEIEAGGRRLTFRRAVIAADASFVENAGIGLGANRDLALNAILWLVKDESWIAVRPRAKTGALLFLTPSSREALAFALMFLIPVTLAALGAARAASRR
jgi:hypothetical protein